MVAKVKEDDLTWKATAEAHRARLKPLEKENERLRDEIASLKRPDDGQTCLTNPCRPIESMCRRPRRKGVSLQRAFDLWKDGGVEICRKCALEMIQSIARSSGSRW